VCVYLCYACLSLPSNELCAIVCVHTPALELRLIPVWLCMQIWLSTPAACRRAVDADRCMRTDYMNVYKCKRRARGRGLFIFVILRIHILYGAAAADCVEVCIQWRRRRCTSSMQGWTRGILLSSRVYQRELFALRIAENCVGKENSKSQE
jgi:hypothetical protein